MTDSLFSPTVPSYRPGAHDGRTEVVLYGGTCLKVRENPGSVLGQLDRSEVWVMLTLATPDAPPVHVRSESVVALVELRGHPENVRPLHPVA